MVRKTAADTLEPSGTILTPLDSTLMYESQTTQALVDVELMKRCLLMIIRVRRFLFINNYEAEGSVQFSNKQ